MPLPSSQCASVSHQFRLQWFSSDLAPVSNVPLTPHDIAIVLHLFSPLFFHASPRPSSTQGNLSKHTLCLELFCFHKLALPKNKMVCLKGEKGGKRGKKKRNISMQALLRALWPQSSLKWWFPSSATSCCNSSPSQRSCLSSDAHSIFCF